ncbi:carboxyl-terminal processing protease [Formosa sp. Hel1_31_208]|uniref:carboxy terminal-processing peptidase n=1 Tax=Formosa sp. Hel1_31_208 TaxID=1798225 RepID=UPI00087AD5F6|nr:carboxy terminal-processing peptidase [Formosa sp. Hel1_31_208]SDS63298.1 carboxyl-terminal processing protease [Formosa sp. Hel1_31_208]
MLKRLLVFIGFFAFYLANSQNKGRFCDQLKALQKTVTTNHYLPKAVDDSLSTHVFDLFIQSLDEEKRLLIQSDIDALDDDRFKLDDYIKNNNCEFIDKYINLVSKRIESGKTILASLEQESFDYSGKDTLRFKPDLEYNYLKDEAAIKRFWSKRIRYNILYSLIETDSVLKTIKADFITTEKELKPKLIQKEICKLNELQNQLGSIDLYVKELFLNAYLHYHDPNSSFFNSTEKDMFENALSNDAYSFGIITAKTDAGDIIIAHITPGSAAFNDGNFDVNDIIKSLKTDFETLETYCVSNNDVLAFTTDEKHNTVTFKIKKENGAIKDIKLTKTKTKIEDNTVSGYIIEDKSKVGYISITNFYTDLESPNGLGLANDVAKELYKLQKENIKGLILDLRFNGGGSMKEASDLSGLFINRGPLSILKYNNGETYTIQDVNSGSLFTKPMVILVNNYSASASEFFAATMQDYNRAVIVGARTHGKASAQVILPLDENENLGFSKLTIEKFYRVTGQSHQSKGVMPDIELPNIYDNFKTQEQYEAYALKNDSITGVINFPRLKSLPIVELQKRSTARVSSDISFKAIKDLNRLIIENYFELDTEYLLTLDNVYRELINYHNRWEAINKPINNHVSEFEVKNSAFNKENTSNNAEKKRMNQSLLQEIKQDIYIGEAQTILQDLLNLNPLN